MTRREHPALIAAARVGLPVAHHPVEMASHEAERVLLSGVQDHLEGFVVAAINDGILRVPDWTERWATELWHEALTRTVAVEALAVRVGRVLSQHDVEWRLTKGPAVAHLDYLDPTIRLFSDIDVVVHPACWERAVEVLERSGYRREQPELHRGFDDRFGKGATLVDGRGLEVDLHRRFAVGRFAVRSRMSALFAEADVVELAGNDLPTLDRTGRFLHACFHATLGGFSRLRAVRDVAQLLVVNDADWVGARRLAERWRAEAVVATAILESWSRLELAIPHPAVEWASKHPMTAADRRALAVFRCERPYREQALTALPVLRRRDVLSYLGALAAPRSTGRTTRGSRRVGRLVGALSRSLRPTDHRFAVSPPSTTGNTE